jgi:DNA-binding transcriptional LysR family regulator
LEAAHRFSDEFVLILPPRSVLKVSQPLPARRLGEVLSNQRWLLITRQSNTGKRLQGWLKDAGLRCEPAIEADNFDFIVNLVSLGLGISLVPHRVLALYPGTRPVIRVRTEPRFSRELAVVVRRESPRAVVLSGFLENVLF